MKEEWRTVVYDGEIYDNYEVSNMGRVRSLNYNGIKGRVQIMKPQPHTRGYLQIGLRKNGKYKTFTIHSLVANVFLPKIEGKNEINHIDENKHNNTVENLEWCDRQQNCNYGTKNERKAKTDGKKIKCIETGKIYYSIGQARKEMGLKSRSGISACCSGKQKTAGGYHWEYVD